MKRRLSHQWVPKDPHLVGHTPTEQPPKNSPGLLWNLGLQSVDRLIAALHGFKIRDVARLKATDAKHLPKPVTMALRRGDKVSKGPEELLKWIKSLNPELHMQN
jgi:hypothetical protein